MGGLRAAPDNPRRGRTVEKLSCCHPGRDYTRNSLGRPTLVIRSSVARSRAYAVDDAARQQFLRRRHPDRRGRGVEDAIGELRRQAGAVDQEAAHAAVAFVHVVVAHAGKAGAVEAQTAPRPDAALDAAQEGERAGRGAAGVDTRGKLALAEQAEELEASRGAAAGAPEHDLPNS